MGKLDRTGMQELSGQELSSVGTIHLIPNNWGVVVCHMNSDLMRSASRRGDLEK